jgi:SulP family sulfate permease
LDLTSQLFAGALAIAAIGLVEAISIARKIANETGQRLDSNQEFIGQGFANIACGFFSGYTCSGSFTRSALNQDVGAKSPISNVFCGLFVLTAVIALGSFTAYIPLASLAGVVILVAIGLIDRKEILRIWHGTTGDQVIMVVTFSATMLLPLQFAVLLGILISLTYYLLKTSMPTVQTVLPDENFEYFSHQPDKPNCPQLGVIEILGDLYFGAAHHFEESLLENISHFPSQRFLLLRLFSVEHCDVSGIRSMEGILRKYRQRGGDIFVSRYQESVYDVMCATGFKDLLGEDHYLGRDMNAIGYLFNKVLDPAVCIYECPIRVFKECQNLPKRLDLAGEHLHTEIPTCDLEFIDPQYLWHALHSDNPPCVIDVREPREYKKGHIPQAMSIPMLKLISEPTLLPENEEIVLLCRSERRSTRTACMLLEEDRIAFKILRGGMLAWESANLFEAVDDLEG